MSSSLTQSVDTGSATESRTQTRSSSPSNHGGKAQDRVKREADQQTLLEEYYAAYPNRWSRVRAYLREPAAEFFGTMVFIILGCGVNCQVVLSSNPNVAGTAKGDFLSITFGWACGLALGVWLACGISGGHLNPAVTLSFAVFRKFPWKKVPIFWLSQLLGAVCGAGIVYANYFRAIDIYEGGQGVRTISGTAGLFGTYALDYMTPVSCFFNEFVGTVMLMLVILAITDKKNGPPPAGLVPLVIFVAILGISGALGMQTGFALNPARDLGPRILTAMVGYSKDVFNFRQQYWIWCPILAPFSGALVATLAYDSFFFTGSESIINFPDAAAREHKVHVARTARYKNHGSLGVDSIV